MKNNLILSEGIRHSSKKLITNIAAICLVPTLGICQTVSTAQESLPSYCNGTRVYNSNEADKNAEIIKVLREKLERGNGYNRNYLSMLSDNEILHLYYNALSKIELRDYLLNF